MDVYVASKQRQSHVQNKNFGISLKSDTDSPCNNYHEYVVVAQDLICSSLACKKGSL